MAAGWWLAGLHRATRRGTAAGSGNIECDCWYRDDRQTDGRTGERTGGQTGTEPARHYYYSRYLFGLCAVAAAAAASIRAGLVYLPIVLLD